MAVLTGTIKPREITQEMQESYLDYAMSVIVSRALPDVRDGLKPVHRKILYAMHELGLRPNGKFRKSATVVGHVIGHYHPHGDVAAYDSMVRMAQDFSLRYPLVHGQGNFGSIDGDPPAAHRYCLTGEHFVVTDKGLIPINKLSENSSENINIKVLSKDKIINKASKWFDSGEHPTIKITTSKGYHIKGTYNHPVLVWSSNKFNKVPGYEWKLLNDIKQGDHIVIDRTIDTLWPDKKVSLNQYKPNYVSPRTQIKKLPDYLDEDLAFILGSLVSEGFITDKKIEFCNSDLEWVEDFKNKWRNVFPDCRLHIFEKNPSSFGKKKYFRIEIHSLYVIGFLKNLGLLPVKSKQKTIPETILRSPKPVVASFLRMYFEGDGGSSASKRTAYISCCSVSEELMSQLQYVLLRFGLIAAKRYDKSRRIHKLCIYGLENYRIFYKEIGFHSARKQQKLDLILGYFKKTGSITDYVPYLKEFIFSILEHPYANNEYLVKHNFDRYSNLALNFTPIVSGVSPNVKEVLKNFLRHILSNNYFYDPVVLIEKGQVERVYSVKVDSKCHSFVANGAINHNTEAKLAPIAEAVLADIDRDTVDFVDNFDGSTQEPAVLPTRIPNLLINGSMGIAVGMATNIPPHNLTEVIDGLIHLIDNPDAGVDDLTQFIKGPDFPTGGTIYNEKDIINTYATGRGPIVMRAKSDIIESEKKGFQIIVSEIPYQVNKAELIIKIAELVKEKKVDGIKDVRDESDKDGLRIAVDLKNDAFPRKVLNQLFKYTELQKSFHVNMLGLVDGIQPQTLSLKSLLEKFIEHRQVVVTRRTKFDLRKAEERAHILEGLKKALDHIDEIIGLIKKSESKEDAFNNLIKKFGFSDRQATAILEMRLQALAGLERKKVEDELKEKLELIAYLKDLLAHPKKILALVKTDFQEIKQKYGDERRTKVIKSALKEIGDEELIPEENSLFMLTQGGYIKRIPPEVLKSQKRGGKGLIGMATKEEDVISHFFIANTHDNLMFFTNSGKVFQTKGYEVPESARQAKGKALVNFLQISPSDKITAIIPVSKNLNSTKYLVMTTAEGIIKKVDIEDFSQVRRSGMVAIKLKSGDELKWVETSSGNDEIILTTTNGMAIRFKEKDIRPMGRAAGGVIGIRLEKDAKVVGADIVPTGKEAKVLKLLAVMSHGYGKRTDLSAYKVQNRGGKGIMTAKITSKTGNLVSAHVISEEDNEIIVVSQKGIIIRTEVKSISILGRATQGVRVMKLDPNDAVASVVLV